MKPGNKSKTLDNDQNLEQPKISACHKPEDYGQFRYRDELLPYSMIDWEDDPEIYKFFLTLGGMRLHLQRILAVWNTMRPNVGYDL
jgi:hypothetical protein